MVVVSFVSGYENRSVFCATLHLFKHHWLRFSLFQAQLIYICLCLLATVDVGANVLAYEQDIHQPSCSDNKLADKGFL